MKQQINEFKRMQLIAGLITESEYRESQMNEAKETISVSDAKEYADSWDDDDISMDFEKTFSGKDQIAKSDFINFFKKHIDDMSEMSDIRSAWDQLLSGEGLYETKMDEAEDNEIYLLDFPEDLKDVAKYKQSGFDVELDDPYNKIYSAKLDLTGMDAVGMQTELLHVVKQKGLHPTLWFKGKSYSADKALEFLDKLANKDTYVNSFGTPL